jgi:hypothetical protein
MSVLLAVNIKLTAIWDVTPCTQIWWICTNVPKQSPAYIFNFCSQDDGTRFPPSIKVTGIACMKTKILSNYCSIAEE